MKSGRLIAHQPDQTILDPYWDKVVYYARYDTGPLVDLSGTCSPTANGTITTSTSAAYFGTYGINKTSGSNYLTLAAANNTIFTNGTNDITIETWVNIQSIGESSSVGHNECVFSLNGTAAGSSNDKIFVMTFTAGAAPNWTLGFYDGATFFSGTKKFGYSGWHHIAFSKRSNSVFLSVDGQVDALAASTPAWSVTAGTTTAFNDNYGETLYTAYFDEYRVTKGVARYTANFPVPTKQFPTRTLG